MSISEAIDGSTERPTDIPNQGLVLYVVKASPTSTTNSVKVLILIEELDLKHEVYVVENPGKQAWYLRHINPQGMVPALEDDVGGGTIENRGNGNGASSETRVNVFESSACVQFLVDKYDGDGLFSGRNLYERALVHCWMAVHTAALGATAKWWLWFKVKHPNDSGVALDRLSDGIREQYSILDRRLAEPGQEYIALKDRPTIVDFINLPFANEKIASTASYDFTTWPHLKAWSEKMLSRPKVLRALQRVQTFGISTDEK